MFKYLMLWYRAKTYCPVIDSLENEPDMWVDSYEYKRYKSDKIGGDRFWYKYYDSSSLFHKDLDIEITYATYESFTREVKRNGHKLPVNIRKVKRALNKRRERAAHKRLDAAQAEMNRITQDAQTLRVARIAQLRKELADQEAADFAYRLEHAG